MTPSFKEDLKGEVRLEPWVVALLAADKILPWPPTQGAKLALQSHPSWNHGNHAHTTLPPVP